LNLMEFFAEHPLLTLLLTSLLAVLSIWALIPIACRFGWVDHPDQRKMHEQATPVVGGVGIFIALFLGFLLSSDSLYTADSPIIWLGLSALLLLMVGAADDMKSLSAFLRFLLQICAALLMVGPGGILLADFGPLVSSDVWELGIFAIPITVFATLGVINAFNMIDGLDGLGGTIFLVAAAGMAGFAMARGEVFSGQELLLAMAAVVGFLLLNARFPWIKKARVFLGNSGSMMLGFILAWFLVDLGNGDDRVFMPITAVWLFAVPLLDTSTLIYTRWRSGQSAFEADNQHLHHAFLRAGFRVESTWLAISILAISLALLGSALELSPLPGYWSFYIFMLIAFVYYFYMRHCWSSQRFLGRHFIHHDFTIDD
jgi:UDP-GlcNAc:undecaprenyl-phosphate GlcNAc-1-phosphate transferase